jgi:hypothetical protein
MIALRSGLHFGLLHPSPSIEDGVPYLAAMAGIAGEVIPIVGHQAVSDEVEGIEVLGEDDHTVSVCRYPMQSVLEGLELAVEGDLAERGDILLKIKSLLFQRTSLERVTVPSQ